MPALITNGTTTVAPLSLSAYSSDQAGGAIVHDILGRSTPDVTLRPLEMRTGSLVLDFATEALSSDARNALSASSSWTLTHSERTSVNMRFIVRRLSRAIENNGRWMLSVTWEEVP